MWSSDQSHGIARGLLSGDSQAHLNRDSDSAVRALGDSHVLESLRNVLCFVNYLSGACSVSRSSLPFPVFRIKCKGLVLTVVSYRLFASSFLGFKL